LCGAAPSLFDDLKAARELRPQATILGVKYAASLVPEIEHVWTQHGEMTLKIKAAAGRPIIVHARPRYLQTKKGILWYTPHAKDAYEAIDYLWPGLPFAVGSSGVAGAMWARHGMGFEEVIMAGIGLSSRDTKYAEGYPNKFSQHAGFATDAQIDNWIKILERHQQEGLTEGVYSMSGATNKILGGPSAN
jgi:hypothetical protein